MKTKICTSIEQSKKLLELGLDADTADMGYNGIENRDTGRIWYDKYPTTMPNVDSIPAWSLSALLKLMPQFTLNGFCNGKFNCRDERADNYAIVDSNPLDAAFDMVVYLIEQGYIKTEKK